MRRVIDRTEDSKDETRRIEPSSIVSMTLIFVSTAAMLIAPSIPNSLLAIVAFISFVIAALLSIMDTIRQLFVEAMNRSATLRFSDQGPYGHTWDFL